MVRMGLVCGLLVCLLASVPGRAADFEMYTDNPEDLRSLRAKRADSMSAATNLLAFSGVYHDLQFQHMVFQRILHRMDSPQNVCMINRIKTEQRAEKYLFTLPVAVFLSFRLYQNANYSPWSTSNSRCICRICSNTNPSPEYW